MLIRVKPLGHMRIIDQSLKIDLSVAKAHVACHATSKIKRSHDRNENLKWCRNGAIVTRKGKINRKLWLHMRRHLWKTHSKGQSLLRVTVIKS